MKLFTTVLVFFGLYSPLDEARAPWVLKRDKDHVRVYVKASEERSFYSYRGETQVGASIEKVASLLLNISRYSTWIDRNSLTEFVARKNDGAYYYSVFDAPFPVDDRDVVMRVSCPVSEPGKRVIEHHCFPSFVPKKPENVRVSDSYGKWTLISLSKHETHVVYEGYSDPGGSIPAWLANAFSIDGPYNSIRNLRKILLSEK